MGRMGEKGEISEPIAQISTKSSAGALNAVASSPIADYTTEVCIYTDPNMLSVLEDVWGTRTNNSRSGTLVGEWDEVLLWRDLHRLAEEGLIEPIDGLSRPGFDTLEKRRFRDIVTGDVYAYFPAGERRSPAFRKVT